MSSDRGKRLVIAEIGSCNGDLQLAIDTAHAAIDAGAWLVKGQMFTADTLTTRDAAPYGKGIKEPATQHEAFEKALTLDEWMQVADAVDGRFFASVFHPSFMTDYPYRWVKVASADITYRDLIEAAANSTCKLMISTGGATQLEVERAVKWAGRVDALLACTLSYPTELEDAHLARILTLRAMFGDIVGYSDHTRGTIVADTAFTVGARWVEKHFTLTPGEGGDSDFAITPVQLQRLTVPQEGMQRDWPGLLGDPGLYCRDVEREAVHGARRSLVATQDVAAGEGLAGAVAALRPGGGLEPIIRVTDLWRVVALRDIAAGDIIEHDWVTW